MSCEDTLSKVSYHCTGTLYGGMVPQRVSVVSSSWFCDLNRKDHDTAGRTTHPPPVPSARTMPCHPHPPGLHTLPPPCPHALPLCVHARGHRRDSVPTSSPLCPGYANPIPQFTRPAPPHPPPFPPPPPPPPPRPTHTPP